MDDRSAAELAMTTDVDDLPEIHGEIFADLRTTYLQHPAEDVAQGHLEAMEAAMPAAAVVRLASRRRRRALVTAAVGGAALVLAGGLAAATGNLPEPLQAVADRLVAPFGIDLPGDGKSDSQVPAQPQSDGPGPADAGEVDQPNDDPASGGTADSGGRPAAGAPPSTVQGTQDRPDADDPAGQPGNRPAIPPGQVEQPGNRPEVPPGQSGQQGNQPDTPPGQSGQQGNQPDTPPGQSGQQGNKPDVPPGQSQGNGSGKGSPPDVSAGQGI